MQGIEHFAEVKLGTSANIEDAYSPLCGPTLCVHTTALCSAVEIMRALGVESIDEDVKVSSEVNIIM